MKTIQIIKEGIQYNLTKEVINDRIEYVVEIYNLNSKEVSGFITSNLSNEFKTIFNIK
jgi:hypothetical protein